MEEWGKKREEARREGERLWTEMQARTRAGQRHETLLTAGQTSGGIKEILPVAEIIRQLATEAETLLSRGPNLASR
jgi:NAD(P)H-dependent flavin oxidoreductase YrpB (nitropropane dioxygenase family)